MNKYLTRFERVLVAKHECELKGEVFVPSNRYEEHVLREAKADSRPNWRALVFAMSRNAR